MKQSFLKGIKAGIPIAIGYIPIGIAFGLLAESFNIPNYISIMMSLIIFAGASQFVGIELIAAGVTPFELVITTFIVNFRHFLMSATLSQRVEKISNKWLAIVSFGVTDETFSVATLQKDKKLNFFFILGLSLIGYVAWNVGTLLGLFLALSLPQSIQDSMGIALYAMFIGLLMPNIKNSKPILNIIILAIAISVILYYCFNLSSGWSLIITTVVSSLIGAIVYPKESDAHA